MQPQQYSLSGHRNILLESVFEKTKKEWSRIVKNKVIHFNIFLLSSGKPLRYIFKRIMVY